MEIIFNKTKKLLLTSALTLLFISCATTIFAANTFNLNISSATLYEGKSLTLRTEGQNLEYKSSDSNIASVDAKGIVTAKNKGNVVITAKNKTSGETDSCEIKVKQLSWIDKIRGGMKLNVTSLTLHQGYQVGVFTDKSCTWNTTNKNVAEVSSGVITGKKPGIAIISAKVDGKTLTCWVTVKKAEAISEIGVSGVTVSGAKTVEVGKTIALTATVQPTNATNKNVTWGTTDSSIATVSTSGVVTGKKAGSVKITATAGVITTYYAITVTNPPAPDPYQYTFGGITYKTIVTKSKLDQVLAKIDSANIEQTTNRDAWDGLAGQCAAVATYYMKMLNGNQAISTATREGAKYCSTSYADRVWNSAGVKNIVDTKSFARLYLENPGSSMHWAVVIGYIVDEDGKDLGDYLLLDPYSGCLVRGGTGIACTSLKDRNGDDIGDWQANIVYDNR